MGRFDGEVLTIFTVADGLPDNKVRALTEDREGGLWLGTRGGLVYYNGLSFTVFTNSDGLPGNEITDLVEDDEGGLWIGTT